MATGSPKPTTSAMNREPTWPTAVPMPNALTIVRELTWLAAAPGSRIWACRGNQHGRRQPWAYSSHHAPGTNTVGGSLRPTAPAMPWEPTWPVAAPGPQLLPCPGTNMAARQPRDHSTCLGPGTNMAGGSPRPTAPAVP